MDLKKKKNETQTERENHSQDPRENGGGGEKQAVKDRNFKTTPGGKDEATNSFFPDVTRTGQDRTCPEAIKNDGVMKQSR